MSIALFPPLFLLVFFQLAVGGFFALSIPPFREVDRGYFKSSALVNVLFAVLALIGRIALWWQHDPTTRLAFDSAQVLIWTLFTLLAAGYAWTLWGERVVLRARLFAATCLIGLLGLIVTASAYLPSGFTAAEVLIYPAAAIVSALLLGAASAGMLLGHWYLIDRDLSLTPFRHMLQFYFACLIAQSALVIFGSLILVVAGGATTVVSLSTLIQDHWAVLMARIIVSPLGAGVLAFMIHRTLLIPQTMAATGLFYIATLAVIVGEFMGRFILFRTGLPL